MPVIRLKFRGSDEWEVLDCVSYDSWPLGAPFYVLRVRGEGERVYQASEVVVFERMNKEAKKKEPSGPCGASFHDQCTRPTECGCDCHAKATRGVPE